MYVSPSVGLCVCLFHLLSSSPRFVEDFTVDHGLSCFRSSRFDFVPLVGVVSRGKPLRVASLNLDYHSAQDLGDVLCVSFMSCL